MIGTKNFDTIIIGGSFSGLSAAMSLGRFMHKVLVVDSGKPCNIRTPRSHNFLSRDGQKPEDILAETKEQLRLYTTISFKDDEAVAADQTADGFEVKLKSGEELTCRKLILATGVVDLLPDIPGFSESWGISVVHCPYCHGYENRELITTVIAQGNAAFEMTKIVRSLSSQVTLVTNGTADLDIEQRQILAASGIEIIEKEVAIIHHQEGKVHAIAFEDGTQLQTAVIYTTPQFQQHSKLAFDMGCRQMPNGLIEIDKKNQTSLKGVFACGDSVSAMRSVARAVASGSFTGAMVNNELCEEALTKLGVN